MCSCQHPPKLCPLLIPSLFGLQIEPSFQDPVSPLPPSNPQLCAICSVAHQDCPYCDVVSSRHESLSVCLSPFSFIPGHSSKVWTMQCEWVPHVKLAWLGAILVPIGLICGLHHHVFLPSVGHKAHPWLSISSLYCSHSLTEAWYSAPGSCRSRPVRALGSSLSRSSNSPSCRARGRGRENHHGQLQL